MVEQQAQSPKHTLTNLQTVHQRLRRPWLNTPDKKKERKGRNHDNVRSQETYLPRTIKNLRLDKLEEKKSTMASKSTTLTAKTQQLDSKTNHTVHPNPKRSPQRKASAVRTSNPSQFKESKASSKSSAIQKPSPGLNAEAYKSKNSAENLSTDLEVGKNYFTHKKLYSNV